MTDPTDEISWVAVAQLMTAQRLGELRTMTPLKGGWINRVYLLNDEYVLRVRPEGKGGGAFLTEAVLFDRLRPRLPVPEVLFVDISRTHLAADVMLSRRLPGDCLARVWQRASPLERERLAAVFAALLEALHQERFPACGGFTEGVLVQLPSWTAYLAERFERRLSLVRACPGADLPLLDAIWSAWRRAIRSFGAEDARLIHRDLHFGNVLVEDGRITGLLDFEAAVSGPIDYELDQILRFVRYPQLFLEPGWGGPNVGAAFLRLLPLLQRDYPALFAARRLEERLAIYSLEYDLAALRDCYTGRWGAEAHSHVRSRIQRALEGRVCELGRRG